MSTARALLRIISFWLFAICGGLFLLDSLVLVVFSGSRFPVPLLFLLGLAVASHFLAFATIHQRARFKRFVLLEIVLAAGWLGLISVVNAVSSVPGYSRWMFANKVLDETEATFAEFGRLNQRLPSDWGTRPGKSFWRYPMESRRGPCFCQDRGPSCPEASCLKLNDTEGISLTTVDRSSNS